MNKNFIIYGSLLKEIRLNDKRKISQSDVAKKINMPLDKYTALEKDYSYSFDYDKMEKFCELFNLTDEQKSSLH